MSEIHKSLVVLQNKNPLLTNGSVLTGKTETIEAFTTVLNNSPEEYEDGESIVVRYYDPKKEKIASINGVINKVGNVITISSSIDDSETLKIVEQDDEPQNKDLLWIVDEDDEGSLLEKKVKVLEDKVAKLETLLAKHEYMLTKVLEGGNFLLNSEKYREENSAIPEIPENGIDNTPYAKEDFTITKVKVFLGNTELSEYSGGEGKSSLYKNSKYILKHKYFNAEDEQVHVDYDEFRLNSSSEILTISGNSIYATSSGGCELIASAYAEVSGETYDNLRSEYYINFLYNEKPDYPEYKEPNAPHITLKYAETYQELIDNTDYLCINEFVWCKENSGLYLKAQTPGGVIGLFHINGGSTPITPTGQTETQLVMFNEGILELTDSEGGFNIDENGILTIESNLITYDENGNIIITTRGLK